MASAEQSLTSSAPPRLPLAVLYIAVGYFLVVKLLFATLVPPNADEAYYWLWGQHLQWSYLDHAPLVGWTGWLGSLLLGWSIPALRLAPLLSFAAIVAMLWLWSPKIAPDEPRRFFWTALAIYLASPLMNVLSTLNYPDHLLIAFSIASVLSHAAFIEAWKKGQQRWPLFYLGALCLGLAGLGKYNAVFVAIGLLAALLGDRRLRPLFRSPHLYLAGLVTLVTVSPVFWWNLANGFPTLKLHTVQRFAGREESLNLLGAPRMLLLSALFLSPFLVWGLARFLLSRRPEGLTAALQTLGRGTFLASTLAMLLLASWSAASKQVVPHWNVVAFVPFLLAAPFFVRSRWLLGFHIAYGAVAITLGLLYYLTTPVLTDAFGIGDGEAVITYGQDQLATAVRDAATSTGASLIAAPSYEQASKLAFALGSDHDVISLTSRVEQFDFWRDAASDAGQDSIIVGRSNAQSADFATDFTSVEPLGPVATNRFGRRLYTYQLFLGRGYRP